MIEMQICRNALFSTFAARQFRNTLLQGETNFGCLWPEGVALGYYGSSLSGSTPRLHRRFLVCHTTANFQNDIRTRICHRRTDAVYIISILRND